jgi:hypothetical protein
MRRWTDIPQPLTRLCTNFWRFRGCKFFEFFDCVFFRKAFGIRMFYCLHHLFVITSLASRQEKIDDGVRNRRTWGNLEVWMGSAKNRDNATGISITNRSKHAGVPAEEKHFPISDMPSAGLIEHSQSRWASYRPHACKVIDSNVPGDISSQNVFYLDSHPVKLDLYRPDTILTGRGHQRPRRSESFPRQ